MNKGITLITLTITIIVLMILAGVSGTIGFGMFEQAKKQDLTRQLSMVNNAILEQYTKYYRTKDKTFLLGIVESSDNVKNIYNQLNIDLPNISLEYEDYERTYYLLDEYYLNEIGIKDCEDEYIVNYLTGEVLNKTKAEEGEKYYIYSRIDNSTEVIESLTDNIRISTTPNIWTNNDVNINIKYDR